MVFLIVAIPCLEVESSLKLIFEIPLSIPFPIRAETRLELSLRLVYLLLVSIGRFDVSIFPRDILSILYINVFTRPYTTYHS